MSECRNSDPKYASSVVPINTVVHDYSRLAILVAFLATISAYVVLALSGDDTSVLKTLLFIEIGGLVGVSIPNMVKS